MPEAINVIAHTEVGVGGASTITFSSIPSTYSDIMLVLSLRSDLAVFGSDVLLQFNNDTGANYSRTIIYGASGTAASFRTSSLTANGATGSTSTANTFASTNCLIPNYANTTNFKQVSSDYVIENNSSTDYRNDMLAGLWRSTSAINSIKLTPSPSGSFVQYSTATLYGITKA